jgi:UDP-GlcNAc3NAcA epimerase
MKKIVTVIGARPQFIKSSVVSLQFQQFGIEEVIVHTGQHFDENMSQIFFDEMEIPAPRYNLNIHSLPQAAMTGQMMEKIEQILIAERPDNLLVYGDTNSTLAGALAAAKLQIPVIHIEAGLRSFNNAMPEEINRILTDRISSLLFCPTDISVQNLKNEGFNNFDKTIVKNGDVMQDAALHFAEKAESKSQIISRLDLKDFVLATFHRQENTTQIENLKNIVEGLNLLNRKIPVIVPLHPGTRNIILKFNILTEFRVIEPVGYLDMLMLLKNCKLVITDSGGLQKEAYFFDKHCITLRNESEWRELIENGYNILAGTNPQKLLQAFDLLINTKTNFAKNLYGNGNAAKIAVENIAL